MELSDDPVFFAKYEFGFPNIKGKRSIILKFTEYYVDFEFTNETITFIPEEILEVGFNEETYRSAGKAAAGAIVGGLLTGGIGLLAGAALGGKRRKENHLHLVVNYMENPCEISFKHSMWIPDIYEGFKLLMNKQAEAPQKLDEIGSTNNETEGKSQTGVYSELEKLHDLFQKGILTKDEFDAQKEKLLKS